MKRTITRLAAWCILLSLSTHAHAFIIELDYTYDTNNFFGNQAAKNALTAAADFFESVIVDEIDEINAATFGNNATWTPRFTHPGDGTMNFTPAAQKDRVIAADTIVVFAGARNLGSSTLGVGETGGATFRSNAPIDAWEAVVTTRGETNATGAGATDFARWGGSITLDTHTDVAGTMERDWHLDHTTDPGAGENDLFSVALHELGHLLGLGTADSWNTYVSGGEFTGPASVAEFGSNVPLDGDLGHFEDDVSSNVFPNGAPQETAMDPSLTVGERKVFTDLDVAALEDVGWDTPEPTSATILIIAGTIGVLSRRRAAV